MIYLDFNICDVIPDTKQKHDPCELVCFDTYEKIFKIFRYLPLYCLFNNNVSVPSECPQDSGSSRIYHRGINHYRGVNFIFFPKNPMKLKKAAGAGALTYVWRPCYRTYF